MVGLLASVASRSAAQERPQLKRPQEAPEEKPAETKKTKKGKDPRAVGLLQLTSSGKATLIPIAILVDGRFYDASAYKADPVPMALESGTVYEAEQGGDSQGLFTVIGALHKSAGSATSWMGTGSFVPHGAEVAKTTHKAEDVPVGLDNSDEPPPRLTKNAAKPDAAPAASSESQTSAAPGSAEKRGTTGPSTPSSSPPSESSSAGTPAGTSSGRATPSSTPSTSGEPAASDKAEASGKAADQNAAASQASASASQENYYRPALRRGKPTETAPEEDEAAPKANKAASAGAAAPASSGTGQLVPAISDASGPDPRSYKFFWKTGEEEEKRKQMLALAAEEVREYARAQARNQIPARPPAVKATAASHKAAKAVEPVFENVQFRAFDVWVNNQPVMILTADAHFPPAQGTLGVAAMAQSYSIALVARSDIYGDLRKLYSGVTDKSHLDVTPRLDLIDVVDADGDGRGELLFRETSDAGSGYVIYRATPDKLWKMFDTLNAE
jgi:hypothetical protein